MRRTTPKPERAEDIHQLGDNLVPVVVTNRHVVADCPDGWHVAPVAATVAEWSPRPPEPPAQARLRREKDARGEPPWGGPPRVRTQPSLRTSD